MIIIPLKVSLFFSSQPLKLSNQTLENCFRPLSYNTFPYIHTQMACTYKSLLPYHHLKKYSSHQVSIASNILDRNGKDNTNNIHLGYGSKHLQIINSIILAESFSNKFYFIHVNILIYVSIMIYTHLEPTRWAFSGLHTTFQILLFINVFISSW